MQTLIDFAIHYWAQMLFTAMSGGVGYLFRRVAKKLERNEHRQSAMENGIQALLRDRIVQAYYHYHDDKGFITLHGLEAVDKMYAEYHNLGGNGTVTKLWEDMHRMEVRDD
ncbi:MAG: hypothetical protein AB7C89_06440 [Intestinibacillus sp.]